VDDPGKLYRQRRRATQVKLEGPSKSPRESPPPSHDAGRPFKIKRRMENMEMEKEAQHLKAAKARSTCEDCEEHDHVQEDAVTKIKAMEKILKNLVAR
jgi:hypothetical protein